jgi:glutamine phosphoribosylpyrophosphate amidotransferase
MQVLLFRRTRHSVFSGIRPHYIGCTFIQPPQFMRPGKMNHPDAVKGKRVLVVDDPIAGTTGACE